MTLLRHEGKFYQRIPTTTTKSWLLKRPNLLQNLVYIFITLLSAGFAVLYFFELRAARKLSANTQDTVTFHDISAISGLERGMGPRKKYGGAAIADLDGDGILDLLTVHHDRWFARVYYGKGDGTFMFSGWQIWFDNHALNPVRLQPWDERMYFALTRGGNHGKNPRSQRIYRINANRTVSDVSEQVGIASGVHGTGRGRSVVFANLQDPGVLNSTFPDAVFLNAKPNPDAPGASIQTWGFQGAPSGRFTPRNISGNLRFNKANEYGTVADVDGDGRVELITFFNLRVHAIRHRAFQLDDITEKVLPKLDYSGTIAVAEFDFDNDGLFDLYICRSNKGSLEWIRSKDIQDRLLKNMGGYYVDYTSKMGIYLDGASTGVTTGDFDNDGYVDLVVNRRDEPDILMLNKGGKEFVTYNAGFMRNRYIPGDMSTAADLNNDGKLDLVVSEGDWHVNRFGGFYRIIMNSSPNLGKYLLVRVLSSPLYTASSMHATVQVSLGNDTMKLIRRVGSPGTAVSISYIETVHFGVGNYTTVDSVSVKWTDGFVQTVKNVPTGQRIILGRSPSFNSTI